MSSGSRLGINSVMNPSGAVGQSSAPTVKVTSDGKIITNQQLKREIAREVKEILGVDPNKRIPKNLAAKYKAMVQAAVARAGLTRAASGATSWVARAGVFARSLGSTTLQGLLITGLFAGGSALLSWYLSRGTGASPPSALLPTGGESDQSKSLKQALASQAATLNPIWDGIIADRNHVNLVRAAALLRLAGYSQVPNILIDVMAKIDLPTDVLIALAETPSTKLDSVKAHQLHTVTSMTAADSNGKAIYNAMLLDVVQSYAVLFNSVVTSEGATLNALLKDVPQSFKEKIMSGANLDAQKIKLIAQGLQSLAVTLGSKVAAYSGHAPQAAQTLASLGEVLSRSRNAIQTIRQTTNL